MDYFIAEPDKKADMGASEKQHKHCTANVVMYFQALGASKAYFPLMFKEGMKPY